MGLSASQGRMLLLTARRSDLEFRAQQISQKRLVLSQQLEDIATDYEEKTSDRQMKLYVYNGQTDANGNKIKEKTNLTYAALMSGLSGYNAKDSGVNYKNNTNSNYQATTPYRLKDANGNIVVADKSEIPVGKIQGTIQSTTTSTAKAGENIAFDGKNYLGAVGEYSTTSGEGYYNANKSKVMIDGEIYETKTGKKTTAAENEVFNTAVNIVPAGKTLTKTTSSDGTVADMGTKLKDLGNNRYVAVDAKGVEVGSVYVVDPGLNTGATDSNGNITGENYLQDCIRNGKYLLETCAGKKNSDNEMIWTSVSWDATTDIADEYYTDNDDKAKAKYDRLQTQIQNQDKKLELELDNIETQRSAVTTEIESVQKVIDDNIESTFKSFA